MLQTVWRKQLSKNPRKSKLVEEQPILISMNSTACHTVKYGPYNMVDTLFAS